MERQQKQVILITGGSRSGKSRHGLELAGAYGQRFFIATAEALDAEMRDRIAKHQQDRGHSFVTIEEPRDLARAVASLPHTAEVALVDCLTVWLGNLMHYRGTDEGPYPEVVAFLDLLKNPPCHLILVTGEVGSGIVPDNPLSRRFRDLAGWVNQEAARHASQVILMVSGIPVVIKSRNYESTA